MTGSAPATINGSDTCVCFIRHMQSPGQDPNIHYFGFLSLFYSFFFFFSRGDHYFPSFTSAVQQIQCVFQTSVSYTSLIRSVIENCQEKQILKGTERERGRSRFRATSKSRRGLDLQIGTALMFEGMFGFLP